MVSCHGVSRNRDRCIVYGKYEKGKEKREGEKKGIKKNVTW